MGPATPTNTARWSAEDVAPLNACVLLFNCAEYAEVIELVRQQGYLPQLADHLTLQHERRTAQVITTIGYPA